MSSLKYMYVKKSLLQTNVHIHVKKYLYNLYRVKNMIKVHRHHIHRQIKNNVR